METNPLAQGWYRDPYRVHEDRHMSAGLPTKLVRDGGCESYDVPPDRPLPEGDLVPVEQALYPELAAHRQLAGAIQAAAAELGLDLGTVAPGSDPRREASVDSSVPDRQRMTIGLGAVERRFLIKGGSPGVALVGGATPDLREVVRAAAGWRRGASLDEIQQAAPFVQFRTSRASKAARLTRSRNNGDGSVTVGAEMIGAPTSRTSSKRHTPRPSCASSTRIPATSRFASAPAPGPTAMTSRASSPGPRKRCTGSVNAMVTSSATG